jgi:hypothetical protein
MLKILTDTYAYSPFGTQGTCQSVEVVNGDIDICYTVGSE